MTKKPIHRAIQGTKGKEEKLDTSECTQSLLIIPPTSLQRDKSPQIPLLPTRRSKSPSPIGLYVLMNAWRRSSKFFGQNLKATYLLPTRLLSLKTFGKVQQMRNMENNRFRKSDVS